MRSACMPLLDLSVTVVIHFVMTVTATGNARGQAPSESQLAPKTLGVGDRQPPVVPFEQPVGPELGDHAGDRLARRADRVGKLLMGDLTAGRTRRVDHG